MNESETHRTDSANAGWQPIETAPDRKRVLVTKAGGFRFIAYSIPDSEGKMKWLDDRWGEVLDLTYWHPLPAFPQQPSQEKAR